MLWTYREEMGKEEDTAGQQKETIIWLVLTVCRTQTQTHTLIC